MSNHAPVLLNQACGALNITANGIYVDGTFGRGGHSQKILQQLGEQGRLIAIDQDLAAIEFGQKNFTDSRFELIHSKFSQLPQILKTKNLVGKIDGMLFDFGVSSPQLDQAERGFSFQQNGTLDMRMNQSQTQTAQKWLMSVDEIELANVLWQFGGERKSRQIAKVIVEQRLKQPLVTTFDLVACVKKTLPGYSKKHPATRTFQAIRIFINQELNEIKLLLTAVRKLLKIGGSLVTISFHSLEDQIVKAFFKPIINTIPAEIPIQPEVILPYFTTEKIMPNQQEIALNPRARSAIMRIAKRIR